MGRIATAESQSLDSKISQTDGMVPGDAEGRGVSDLPDNGFRADIIDGLTRSPKQLHPKYFYDRQGSLYFDQICGLDEYYPYRAELHLLPEVARELQSLLTEDYTLIEFGAGSLRKVEPLLDAISGIRRFTPIDISGEHLHTACRELRKQYPQLRVEPVVADFSRPVELVDSSCQRLGFFPGSTIGNFAPRDAEDFLVSAGKTLGAGSYMLIGVDTKKSPERLHAAYNDGRGITARFNRNILERINRELGADFQPHTFRHYAFYNPAEGRIEMHLVSAVNQYVTIGGHEIHFREGESIHTENSYKYSPNEFIGLASDAGWRLERQWFIEEGFAVAGAANDALFATYLIRYEG